jgi:hypothetical protein
MILALARHIFEHGTDGRFYSQVRKYHHEGGKVYWSMDDTPEETELINRCDEAQTYEARLAAGTLPKKVRPRARSLPDRTAQATGPQSRGPKGLRLAAIFLTNFHSSKRDFDQGAGFTRAIEIVKPVAPQVFRVHSFLVVI